MNNKQIWGSALVALASIVSMNFGASWAKTLMLEVGADGAAWLRFAAATVSLLAISAFRRVPRKRKHLPLKQWPWRRVLGYTLALLVMNWSIYHAFFHLPVGMGVTIELLGPLTLAVIGSRGMGDYFWVGLAGAGVLLLGFQPQASVVGICWALVAALCWALYIVAGSKLSDPNPVHLLLFTHSVGTLVLAPFALPKLLSIEFDAKMCLAAVLVGVFSAALPFTLELIVLSRIPSRLFAILQVSGPAIASLMAWLVIGETLTTLSWLAIAAVIGASLGATVSTSRN